MSNAMSGQPQPQQPPPLESLIKAGQILNIAAIPAEEKDKYHQGVKTLWDKINSHPPDHPEYQNAYKRLAELSVRVKGMINKYNQNQSHAAPPKSGNNQFSDRILETVRNMKMVPPPQYWTRPQEEGQGWIRDNKLKYAQGMQRLETAKMLLSELMRNVREKQQAGKTFSLDEQHAANNRKMQYHQAIAGAEEWLTTAQNAQEQYKLKHQQHLAEEAAARNQPAGQFGKFAGVNTSQAQEGTGSHLNIPHVPTNQQQSVQAGNQAQALENARAQINQTVRPPINPATPATGQPGQPGQVSGQATTTQNNASQAPSTTAGVSGTHGSHLSINMSNTHSQQQDHSQHVPENLPNTSQQGPYPLSHKAAMAQAARSYSQPTIPQATPQSHAHPQVDNRNQQNKWPISKQLQVSELRPVQMGPARPTLSGGPSTGAPGPVGQPGIQKVPGFVLEGEGERVLSKKKLEELVRQVTGASAAEGQPLLDPDVEEVFLDAADEFVDNLISAACKLAALRENRTLELRDIQLVLERNYNIRIPGYASDELRTVKKIQPTPGWTQKMNAVQAAKLTGGKTDS